LKSSGDPIGIDEQTGMVHDGAQTWTAYGARNVTLYQNRQVETYQTGNLFHSEIALNPHGAHRNGHVTSNKSRYKASGDASVFYSSRFITPYWRNLEFP
jgi:hypothetical protein